MIQAEDTLPKETPSVIFLPQAATTADTDTLEAEEPVVYGLIIKAPTAAEPPAMRESYNSGQSFVILGLTLLFCVIAFRFNNNTRFTAALIRNLVEVKERPNIFDDTVRETSFIVLLNAMWCGATGVILFRLLQYAPAGNAMGLFSFGPEACMGLCMAVAVVYELFMLGGYSLVGKVFSDSVHTALWIKGFVASQAILGMVYFPVALAFICYPEATSGLLMTAAILFIIVKLIFIWKVLRIFFTQISSWVLFLYYLCSLEIVPLILTYITADYICRV